MKAEKFNNPLLNMMNSPSSAADVWTRKQPETETDTEDKEPVDNKTVDIPPVHTYDELKKIRRDAYVKMVAIIGIVVTALVFGSVAWFTESREVEGSKLSMKSDSDSFELAVSERTGAEIYYNTKINVLGYLTGNDNLSTTDGSIRWVMKDESTNISAEDYKGFRPGSYGRLTFYILPNSDADASYTFELKMTGYYAEFVPDANDEQILTKEIKANTFQTLSEKANGDATSDYALAANYLKGHILFFQNHKAMTFEGETDTNLYYSGRIADTFTYNTSDHQEEKTTWNGQLAYEVNIFWIWPNTFGQIVLDSNDDNLYGDAMFSSNQSGTITPRNDLINYISNNPSYFFSTSDLTEQDAASLTEKMSKESLSTTNSLITLSNGYNDADQVIGENVQFILVELTADKGSSTGSAGN